MNPTSETVDIIEGNKLIAEFMGGVTDNTSEWINSDKKLVAFLSYHKDWSELMPVVEKIETMKDGEYPFVVIMFKRCCDIERDTAPDVDFIQITAAKSKLEAAWLAVIEFIKWYNKNNK